MHLFSKSLWAYDMDQELVVMVIGGIIRGTSTSLEALRTDFCDGRAVSYTDSRSHYTKNRRV